MTESQDIVVLQTPRGDLALPVMRVVMAGVASRHALPMERLDDLEMAIETLLAEEEREGGRLTLTVACDETALEVSLGGLTNQALRAALEEPDPFEPSALCRLDVRLFLDAFVDSYWVVDGAVGGAFVVNMQKRAR